MWGYTNQKWLYIFERNLKNYSSFPPFILEKIFFLNLHREDSELIIVEKKTLILPFTQRPVHIYSLPVVTVSPSPTPAASEPISDYCLSVSGNHGKLRPGKHVSSKTDSRGLFRLSLPFFVSLYLSTSSSLFITDSVDVFGVLWLSEVRLHLRMPESSSEDGDKKNQTL